MNERIRDEKLGMEYLRFVDDTGLTILLYPDSRYRSVYALYGAKYGSQDYRFRLESEQEFLEVPAGIAHFLEHKLFESEEQDAFERFGKTGASANAYTSFDKTCYLFSASDNIDASLDILLDFVTAPYFTAETVQKEQGIIGQEITMYDDNPGWQVFFRLLGGLYHNLPVKIDIAGTKESISNITDKLLYRCYNTFYNPKNMVLSIAGGIDPDRIMELVKKNSKGRKGEKVVSFVPPEPREVVEQKVSACFPVSNNLFQLGFKEPAGEEVNIRKELLANLLLELLFGEGSALYCRLHEQGLLSQPFETEVFSGRGYFAEIIGGETKDPDRVRTEIMTEIARVRSEGVSETDFARTKKVLYGQSVAQLGSVEAIATNMLQMEFVGAGLFDGITILSSLTAEDVQEYLMEHLLEQFSCLSVIEPIKEE